MKRYTPDTLPHSAEYIGSTEGPDQISEELADRLDDATAPRIHPRRGRTQALF